MSASPVRFPEELPISARVRDIAAAIAEHPVVIVAGETGSGKTTQLPKICLAMGRGVTARIGVTQPRRIAATSVAARVAEELGVQLGREVGYQIRFSDRTSRETYVKFMTDGILLAEIQGDPRLLAYDTLIVDEAHERSLNIDLLLGHLARIRRARPDLRVIVSSATIEHERFSEFFGGAPVIQVSGRTYPVEVVYRPREDTEGDLADAVAETVDELTILGPRGDVLVFLPGEREIREAEIALAARALPHSVVLPLYGRLAQADQARVFRPLPERRVVLATNVAETSLTIPGIVYVVDAGLARVNRHDPRTGVTRLLIEPISRASADQRKGRAGRTQAGACFRLYAEADYEARPAFGDPEIRRVGLSGAILRAKALGLGELSDYPLLDPPSKKSLDEGYRTLEELGALDEGGKLTEIGDKLARLPVDPRIGRMILGGEAEGALSEVLVVASALGLQDPRERPLAAQARADEAHRKFRSETSDFASLLKLWRFYREAEGQRTRRQLEKLCRDHFLSPARMREWSDLHRQLSSLARELGFRASEAPASDEALGRALLPGLLSRVGMWHPDSKTYIGARQTRFRLHPSSGLARKPPPWVVAAELVETSQLFGRTAARIDPAWLEAAGGALCRRSHGEPFYAERQAQAMVREQVTLFGLPVAKDRKVSLAAVDPAAARRIFILHALVRGEYRPREAPAFVRHNEEELEAARALSARARRRDFVADEDALARFFEARVPDVVVSGQTFEAWRARAEAEDPRVLYLSLEDLLHGDPEEISPARFPDLLEVAGVRLPLAYAFDPGEDEDGITITLPLALLPALDPGVLEWTIPGWHLEKITLLLHGLPKGARRGLGSVPDLARELAGSLSPFEGPMLPRLGEALFELSGVRVPRSAWDVQSLPPHLRFLFRITEGGRILAEGRDLADLEARLGGRAREAWQRAARVRWARSRLLAWPSEALPDPTPIEIEGVRALAYPALVDAESHVDLLPLASLREAEEASRGGLRRLFLMQLGGLGRLEQQVPSAIAASSLSDAGASPRRQIALRAVDEVFALEDPESHPRTQKAFVERLEAGRARLPAALAELGALAREVALELDRARAALRALEGKPGSPRAALDDVRTQLAYLAPPGLLCHTSRGRLAHLPRYLRAVRVRLERLPNGPQKDQAKAAQVLPFWNDWIAQRSALLARGTLPEDVEAFRWLVEEYRVAVFAPELRAALPVSPQRLAEAWKLLTG